MNTTGIATRNLEQYKILHSERTYGTSADQRRGLILPWVKSAKPQALLDYGCGSCTIAVELQQLVPGLRGFRFEPAIPELAEIPAAFFKYEPDSRLVLCSHVMEHVDEDEVPLVLQHIFSLSPRAIFLIPTTKARQKLTNGENAHATVRDAEWWMEALRSVFGEAHPVPGRHNKELCLLTWKPERMRELTHPRKIVIPHRRPLPRTNSGELAPRRSTNGVHPVPGQRPRVPRPVNRFTDLTGKSVAIVGRAASIYGSGEGAFIDSHDIVIRVNIRLPLDRKRVRDTGERTDFVFTCQGCGASRTAAQKAGVYSEPYSKAFRASISGKDGYTPFTGTVAIFEMLKRGARVYATGMDLYVGPPASGQGGRLRLSPKNSYSFHDPNRDAELLRKLLEEQPENFSVGGGLAEALSNERLVHYKGLVP